MTYNLGKRSLRELEGVNVYLQSIVHEAIKITKQDFTVMDGLRTEEEQAKLLSDGFSKTMKSKHLTGDAVDLVPYINGKARWEMAGCIRIAKAMRKAAIAADKEIRWGGSWRILNDMDEEDIALSVDAYIKRKTDAGKRPLVDGPHFERVYS